MSPLPRSTKDWFIDRDDHRGAFDSQVLRGGRAIIFYGDEGTGKTALLQRCKQTATEQGATVALIKLSETNPVDPFVLMHQLERQIAHDGFEPFRGLMAKFRSAESRVVFEVPPAANSISIADGASFTNTRTGDFIGQQIFTGDVHYKAESTRSQTDQRLIEASALFLENLGAVSTERKLILMFDCVDEADQALRDWIWNELLRERSEGRLPEVGVLLTYGAERPSVEAHLAGFVQVRPVHPLKDEHLVEFIVARGMDPTSAKGYAGLTLSSLKGNLRALSVVVDQWVDYFERGRETGT